MTEVERCKKDVEALERQLGMAKDRLKRAQEREARELARSGR